MSELECTLVDVLRRRIDRQQEAVHLRQVVDADTLLEMQRTVETIAVDQSISRYCVSLAAATRTHPHVLIGASPRGALALQLTARAYAVIRFTSSASSTSPAVAAP